MVGQTATTSRKRHENTTVVIGGTTIFNYKTFLKKPIRKLEINGGKEYTQFEQEGTLQNFSAD